MGSHHEMQTTKKIIQDSQVEPVNEPEIGAYSKAAARNSKKPLRMSV